MEDRRPTAASVIVFDFDGTIADSFLTALEVLYELTHRNEPLPDEDISRLRGLPIRQVLRELKIRLWRVPFLLIQARRRLSTRLGEISLVPEIDSAARKLSKEYKLFVLSSNSAENVSTFLERFGIRECFSGIYGGANPLWKHRKLRQLLREQSIAPADAWYVGDEAQDVVAAHRAGMRAVAVAWGYNNIHALKVQRPEALVFSPDELPRCFTNNRH